MSVLSEIFGECPQVKIIETFAENYNDKLYVADIVRMTDVSKITVNSHINKLLKEGIIKKKDKAGRMQFYQLNMNNPKAKMILLLEQFIVSERLGELIEEEEKLEQRTVTKINIPTPQTESSTYTEYRRVDFHPLLDSNSFVGQTVSVGDGYSTLFETGEAAYE